MTGKYLISKGFKQLNDVSSRTRFNWKKFRFESIEEPVPFRTIYQKDILTIIVDGPGASPAVYLKIGEDKPRRFDDIENKHIGALLMGLEIYKCQA
jgi:hypothetical protein